MSVLLRVCHAGLALVLAGNLLLILSWRAGPADGLRPGLDAAYAALCHRLPERCYAPGGEPLPVCARCLGLWLGLFLAAALAAAGRLSVDRRTLRRGGAVPGAGGRGAVGGGRGPPARGGAPRRRAA